jgi:hypothetical protein
MAITSQLHSPPSWGEILISEWQAANLLKPSSIKPVFATVEQSLIIKRLGVLHPFGSIRAASGDRRHIGLAGTGMEYYRNIQLSPELEEAAATVQQEVTAGFEEAERELELMRQEGEAEEMAAE